MTFEALTAQLANYPLLVPGKALWRLLGFESSAAFSRAAKRGAIPFRIAKLPGRRGYFATRADLESWLREVAKTAIAGQFESNPHPLT